jgi:hypoxanthine phosphoribosyltransferase
METRTVGGRKFLILSWADIEKLVENIEEELGRDGYRPDTLVGILRGGMIVADLLSDLLNIREVYVVGCKSYAGLSAGEVRLYHDLLLQDLGGRDVLLVDDVADTGSTLETAVEKILKPRNPTHSPHSNPPHETLEQIQARLHGRVNRCMGSLPVGENGNRQGCWEDVG